MRRNLCGTLWLCGLMVAGIAVPVLGKSGTAIRFQVVDAQGQPVSDANVAMLGQEFKGASSLVQVDKHTWLLKDPAPKVVLDVRDGRDGGLVELALPAEDVIDASFRIRLLPGQVIAELVSTTLDRPVPGAKALPTLHPTRVGQAAVQAGPPANDLCDNAETISIGGMASGSTVTATADSAQTCGTSNTSPGVWYKVVGDGNTLTASLCGSSYDTKLTVYCNTCDDRICVTGTDDGGGCSPQSRVSWCSSAGTEYLILVHGFSSSTGSYTLEVTSDGSSCANPTVCVRNPPPANDACADAEAIAIGGMTSGSTVDATVDAAPFCGTSNTSPGVWYSVIGDGNTLTASLCGSAYDTKLTIYCNGCGIGGLLCVTGTDDGGGCSPQSRVSWCSESGREYLILVHGFSSSVGSYTLEVTTDGTGCPNPPNCGPPTGACCDTGTCVATNTEAECVGSGGTWFAGQTCPAFACPAGCAGDTCASAAVVGSIPYSTSGNSCVCDDQYDEICPFNTPGSPDVVYAYTPAQDECVNISLCNGSAYDTKVYVYENVCGAYQSGSALACNDDACTSPNFPSPYVSSLSNVFLTGGNTYYIVVDGYDGECGDYVLEINPCGPPCDVVCDKNGTPEGEPTCFDGYSDVTNGGCNNLNPVFTTAACNDTICGTMGTYLGELDCLSDLDCPLGQTCSGGICTGGPYELRDTDWYKITLASDTELTMIVEGEVPVLMGIVDTGGVDSCAGVTSFLDFAFGDECDPVSVTACLGAGTWYLFVAPDDFTGYACGSEYQLDILCSNCPTGACCMPNGSCVADQTEPGCALAGGDWLGEGTGCVPNECPQPQANDLCEDAVAVAVPSTTPGTTVGATTDVGFPTCGDASVTSPGVWYEVVGTGNTMTASLCNGVATHDTKISVFCPSCDAPVCVAGVDDSCGLQSEVSWCSDAGQVYQILVHGFGGQTGPFELVVTDDGTACPNPASCTLCPGDGDCCVNNGTPGCNDTTCCETVCACDPFCCEVFWDQDCADGSVGFGVPGCNAAALCDACQPEPPTGACCDGLDCTIETEADCDAAGGRYLGDDTVCEGGGAGVPVVYEEDVNLPIPDNGTPANPVMRTLNVSESFTVGDVNVDLIVSHTWVGDLIVTLEHNGTEVVIVDRMGVPATTFGCSSNDLNVIVDDQGTGGFIEDLCGVDTSALTPTSPPNYRPANALSAFNGMDSAGDWIIRVSDNADFDTGSLLHWSLHIDQPGGNPCIPTGACCLWPDSCEIRTEAACDNDRGVYLGDDSICDALGATMLYEADVNQAIPDNGTPANPASHTINVPDSFTIADANIDLVVSHTWVGDLIVTVTHNATTVTLIDQMGVPATTFGCNSNDLGIILDDEGTGGPIENLCGANTNALTPTSPPNYTPENPLSAFDGMDAAGDWTIEVSDNADFDTGSLISWSLHLTAPGPDPCDGVFTGACCDGNTGGCTNDVHQDECVGDQLSWHKNELCEELDPPCEQHRGACCNGLTGVCTPDVLPQDCAGFQQVWSKGLGCGQVTCLAALGACCDRNTGECVEAVTQAECSSEGQEWLKGQTCDDFDPACEPPFIPTVSAWGLVVMALLLLVFGKVYFGSRRAAFADGR